MPQKLFAAAGVELLGSQVSRHKDGALEERLCLLLSGEAKITVIQLIPKGPVSLHRGHGINKPLELLEIKSFSVCAARFAQGLAAGLGIPAELGPGGLCCNTRSVPARTIPNV